jgi:primosomal protein N'
MRDKNFEKLELACNRMRRILDGIIDTKRLKVTVRGPMPAVISRIQRFHRMQIIIQAPQAAILRDLFSALRAQRPIRPAVKVAIDVDSVNLL